MNVNMKKMVCVAVALVVQCVAIGWLVWRYESIVRGAFLQECGEKPP